MTNATEYVQAIQESYIKGSRARRILQAIDEFMPTVMSFGHSSRIYRKNILEL